MSTAGLAVLLCVAAFLLLPTTGWIQNTEQIPQESVSQPAEEPSAPSQELEPETPSAPPPDEPLKANLAGAGDRPITILGVGDNLIHDGIYKQANRRAGGTGYDFSPVYERVAPYIQQADVAVINQETPLAGDILPLSGYPRFNSPAELGDELVKIGFDVINHANNHILDQGEQGCAPRWTPGTKRVPPW